MSVCQGCGGPLPPAKPGGRLRKWCSERCRKRSYGDPCVDCGTRTCHGADSPRVPEPRCMPCENALRAKAARRMREYVASRWREGATATEIADEIGWGSRSISVFISKLRAEGWDLPLRRPAKFQEQARRMVHIRLGREAAA